MVWLLLQYCRIPHHNTSLALLHLSSSWFLKMIPFHSLSTHESMEKSFHIPLFSLSFFVFFTHFSLPFLNLLFRFFYITFSLFVGTYWYHSSSSSSSYHISSMWAAVFQPWKDKRRNAPFNHSMKRSAGTCWHYYTNIIAFQQNSQLGEQFAWWLFRSGR